MDTTSTPAGAQLVRDALARQRCVVLDGGIATQLEHKHGQEDERLWGMEALASSPAEVLDVHRSYVAAGADVVTTNTWGLATALAGDAHIWDEQREPVHWMEIARRGIRLVRQAIADHGREDDCAVAFALNGDIDRPGAGVTAPLLERAFGDAPPDLILAETLSLVRPSLFGVVEQLVETGPPVWLSFRRCRHGLCGVYGQHWGGPEGDAFGRAARRFEELGVQALLINCIPPDHVDGMISYLRDFTDLPLGVYPNLGYLTNAGWRFSGEVGGEQFAEMALRWREEGADIVGGCCGTGPEHIAAARTALRDAPRGHRRRGAAGADDAAIALARPPRRSSPWLDRSRRPVSPLPLPEIARHRGVARSIPGTYLTWRYLYDENVGAHQRCLDVGSGVGLQTVQLALNGATHVHALDVDGRAVANTLDNAFRNGVADRVTGATADLYPWIPDARYEVIVATLPQSPTEPTDPSSHRPIDYWGRGLVDQVISKLPQALAPEGVALVTVTSILSQSRTDELLEAHGLEAEVVAWELTDRPAAYDSNREHIEHVIELSDAPHLRLADEDVLATYLLEIRHVQAEDDREQPPWKAYR
ncbi:homocysteine S-methyltransferase family protein [Capillimicrobium parvum]|uniref:homocysteine S-methyltransferase family protein n=1 Tax=Capillimicrobium parvum TaxID=2884022 RepID=UPI00216B1F5D|nr:homocysteine S-methyltransferase family protein [Capillimicrobium parvum]